MLKKKTYHRRLALSLLLTSIALSHTECITLISSMVGVQLHRGNVRSRRHRLDRRDTASAWGLSLSGTEGGMLGLVEVLLGMLVQAMRSGGGGHCHRAEGG